MLRFAANLSWMYGEYSVRDRLAAAARDGFTAIEYLFPYEHPAQELAAWLKAHHLSQILLNTPPGDGAAGERGFACLPGKEASFRSALHTALAYAETLGCPRVHVMAGLQPAGIDRATLRDTYLQNMSWAADVAAAAGILLLIEPINQRDIPGYFLNRQQEAHDIVNQIGSPSLKVQMDLYHCQIVEGDVSTKLKQYLPAGGHGNIGHIQVAGVPDRHEPDTGELDYNYLFDLIDTLGYDGWIGCEYRPRAGTSEGLTWLRKRWSCSDRS